MNDVTMNYIKMSVVLGKLYDLTNESNVKKYFNEVLKLSESKRIEQLDVLNPFISDVLNHLEYGEIISVNNRFEPRIVGYFDRISDSPIVIKDSVISLRLKFQNGTSKKVRTYNGRDYFFESCEMPEEVDVYTYSDFRVGEKAVESLLKFEGLSTKKFVESQWPPLGIYTT